MKPFKQKAPEKQTHDLLVCCPDCGEFDFTVNESEIKTVRFAITDRYPFVKERVERSRGKGYDVIICYNCDREFGLSELIHFYKDWREASE